MKEVTLKIEGMNCRSCVKKIEGVLDGIGVEGHVNFEQGTLFVKYDEAKLEISDIQESIQAKGYRTTV
ncbi:heavy-metal-associated domain-containing protein [Paenibacillus assamensis]|uniref:heavy-metal-associated domain-containing protein n=1 Tax=Paenibacillus assamensis TaxID=311244 RepID=UPI0004071A28|nr:heavy metal-associated domain-containing protein [Paenibacillus assamensis]